MAEVKLSIEEYHNVVKNLNTLIKKLYETTKKCSDYKRQRDELINDMAETKRKAEAFDEIVKVLASISKEIVEYPGDNDKQKEVIYKRYDDLFEPMKLLEVNNER
ncbi:hypothetical protein A9J32_07920 [Staphylococcus epidermidis]|uniref:hypothetical protein n=1 Tax=Staphylococcus epidermidis TaxID=1282 RepID=UPI00066C9DF4|nr:hypothetical protein [Staphylococcus epidermidis]MBM6005583.1 hypothetical protein [Staphylococcus epidermidis]MBM6085585.1 hypothetical protein [Staphylococcus epidermidis]MBM6088085.1 hypothetical protein [Staphylococcus epidermidis]MBM6090555.1 hypothetical protein [Staphylococcus epidermidis]MBM6093083.1 hypothetical protein [Staphylococcus epidermidis]